MFISVKLTLVLHLKLETLKLKRLKVNYRIRGAYMK